MLVLDYSNYPIVLFRCEKYDFQLMYLKSLNRCVFSESKGSKKIAMYKPASVLGSALCNFVGLYRNHPRKHT